MHQNNLDFSSEYSQRKKYYRDQIEKFRQELMISSGKDFIPYTYHVPVAVVIAKIRTDFSLIDIVSLDQPEHRPHVMTRHFWTGWEGYHRPTWVTFNGRGCDIPLMEQSAFRFGVSVPSWNRPCSSVLTSSVGVGNVSALCVIATMMPDDMSSAPPT